MRRVAWRLAALAGLLTVPGIIMTALWPSPGWLVLRLVWSAFLIVALGAGALIGLWSS